MAKRVVTKIGDVFSVTLDNGNLRFFQYIANDLSCLNSSVIRVFKKEYPKEYVLKPEEVVSDNIDFYSHTILKFGISDGACLAGTILNGVGEVHINWTSGNTTGNMGLSLINTYISFTDSSYKLENSDISTTWTNAYEACVLGSFSYKSGGVLHLCHIYGGSFTIPGEYRQ